MEIDMDAERPGVILRRRVRELREGRGWSQQRLADEVSACGVTMHQTTIAKIEGAGKKQPPRDVSVDEVFALAAALDVAPLMLLLPPQRDERVQVVPAAPLLTTEDARAWFTGWRTLDGHTMPTPRPYWTERPDWAWHLHENDAMRALNRVDQILSRLVLGDYDKPERSFQLQKLKDLARRAFDEIADYIEREQAGGE